MRNLLLLCTLVVTSSICFAQDKVDLSTVPTSTNGINTAKSNATLLRDATPTPTKNSNQDLAEKYKADNTIQGTFRSVKQSKAQPGTINGSEVLNGNTQQINLGKGSKANSTTYYDNEGRIRGTNTTIKIGK